MNPYSKLIQGVPREQFYKEARIRIFNWVAARHDLGNELSSARLFVEHMSKNPEHYSKPVAERMQKSFSLLNSVFSILKGVYSDDSYRHPINGDRFDRAERYAYETGIPAAQTFLPQTLNELSELVSQTAAHRSSVHESFQERFDTNMQRIQTVLQNAQEITQDALEEQDRLFSVKDLMDEVRHWNGKLDDKLQIHFKPTRKNLMIMGRRVLLKRVLSNIIRNAKEAGATEIHFSAKAFVGTPRKQVVDGHKVRFGIRDNGPGIPDDIKGNVWEPGFTSKPLGVEGTGVGLAFCKSAADYWNGRIGFKSQPGRTDFFVEHPLLPYTPPKRPGRRLDWYGQQKVKAISPVERP